MRAKFVNEIKTNLQNSGLGAIGVGKESMILVYKILKKKFPNQLSGFDTLYNYNISEDDKNSSNQQVYDYITKKLGWAEDEVIYVNDDDISATCSQWISSLFDNTEMVLSGEWYNKLGLLTEKWNVHLNIKYNAIEVHGYYIDELKKKFAEYTFYFIKTK